MRRAVIDSSFLYSRESENHANESKNTILITAVASIGSILVIGLIISPMLTKAETRRFTALEFFLRIPQDKVREMIKNCDYCLGLRDQDRFVSLQKYYQKVLGLKLVDAKED